MYDVTVVACAGQMGLERLAGDCNDLAFRLVHDSCNTALLHDCSPQGRLGSLVGMWGSVWSERNVWWANVT